MQRLILSTIRAGLVAGATLFTFAAAAAASPRARQQSEPTQALPTAREVIDRFGAVCNLRESLEKYESMHAKGKFSAAAMGLEGATELWSAKPSYRRTLMEFGGFGTALEGYDGQVAWMTHPMLGARILKDTELLQSMLAADFDGALKAGDEYESLRTVGSESFEGKQCYKLEIVAKPLSGMDPELTREVRTSHEFYEIETGLLAGSKGRLESELGGGPFTQVFSAYKDFGGQRIATQTKVRQAGQEFVLTVDAVEFDVVDMQVFQPPAEVQKMLEAAAAPRPGARAQ